MAKLFLKSKEGADREIELKPGLNVVGRAEGSDIVIRDGTVSSRHCELTDENGAVFVRDLGSSNGTFIENKPTQEGFVKPGQRLRLGSVELVYADAVSDEKPRVSGLRISRSEEPVAPAPPPAPMPGPSLRPILAPVQRPTNFFQCIGGAFSYPFKRDGLILLVGGTVFFALIDLARGRGVMGAGFGGVVGLFFSVTVFGYLFAFMQQIVSASAHGEENMPGWPEITDFWESLCLPALQLAGIWVVCLGPALAASVFLPEQFKVLAIPLLISGLFYLPMGLLAVAMYDSLVALNPILILPSIARVFGAYTVVCLLLGGLFGLAFGLSTLLETFVPIPIIPGVLVHFLSLYFLTVEMRLLGLLYCTNRDRLGWGF